MPAACARCQILEDELLETRVGYDADREDEFVMRMRLKLHVGPQTAQTISTLWHLYPRLAPWELIEGDWGNTGFVRTRGRDQVRQHIYQIRKLLGHGAVTTVGMVGYRLTAEGHAKISKYAPADALRA